MVNPTIVLAMLASTASAYSWTRCKGVQQCKPSGPPNIYAEHTDFVYDSSNGYWYSKQIDGLFIDPNGYYEPRGSFMLQVVNKPNTWSRWISPDDKPCCLPDEVGTNIAGAEAYGFK